MSANPRPELPAAPVCVRCKLASPVAKRRLCISCLHESARRLTVSKRRYEADRKVRGRLYALPPAVAARVLVCPTCSGSGTIPRLEIPERKDS